MNTIPSAPTVPKTTTTSNTPTSVIQTSTVVSMLNSNSAVALSQQSTAEDNNGVSAQIDNAEINEAVTKVLQGYDWTFAPLATK